MGVKADMGQRPGDRIVHRVKPAPEARRSNPVQRIRDGEAGTVVALPQHVAERTYLPSASTRDEWTTIA